MTKQTPLQKYFAELYDIVFENQRPGNRYHLDGTVTAKIVRLTLAEKFPATKFQIKTRKYAGGCSVDVDWTDGPTVQTVEEYVNYLQGASFNSSDDLKSYVRHFISPEGIFRGGAFQDGNFEVGMMADYVMCNRHNSDSEVRKALAKLAEDYGHYYTLETWNNGGVYDNADRRAIREYLNA